MIKIYTTLLYFLCFTFLMSGCMMSYRQPAPQLLNIPLLPHNNEVALYFEKELPQNKEYYKVIGLSVEGGTDYNSLLIALKNKGKKTGVDAIIHINNSQANHTSPEGNQYTTQILRGIGIRYKENINYLSQYLKSKKVHLYNQASDSTEEPHFIYEANFDMMGAEVQQEGATPDTTYTKYVRGFSFEYLLYDTKQWEYKYTTDISGKVRQRKKYRGEAVSLICNFIYNTNDEVKAIEIIYPNSNRKKILMDLVYKENNRVIEKLMFNKKKKLIFVEKLQYDASGRMANSTLYKIRNKEQIPFVKTVYTYYSIDDLPMPE